MLICIEAPRWTNEPHISVFGIGAIVRCRASSKTVFVGGLDYLGKKALSVSEYIPNIRKKMSQKEIESEVSRKKPFERIEWNGLPYDQPAAVRIEPYGERYIKFIFLEPAPFFYVHDGGLPHLGFEEPGTEPERIRTTPSLEDIFKLRRNEERDEKDGSVWSIWAPYGLRDDVATGRLQFEIRIGSIPEAIRPEEIVGFRTITQDDWKEKTAQQLFQERSLGFVFNPLSKEGRTENRRFKACVFRLCQFTCFGDHFGWNADPSERLFCSHLGQLR